MALRKLFRKISIPLINKFIDIDYSDLILKKYDSKHLKKYGLTIVKEFVNKEMIPNDIEYEIDSLLKEFDTYENVRSIKKLDAFSSGDYKNKCFKVIRRRPFLKDVKQSEYSGFDEGLTDIFNPQLKLKKNHWLCFLIEIAKQKFENDNIPQDFNLQYTHSNLYIYRNVNFPRCLHFDSYKKQFKFFISLNPSFSKDKGCYCYIPYSNKLPLLMVQVFGRLINTIRGHSDLGFYPRTDSTLFNIKNSFPLILSTGDSFVSCQAGVHGDSPSENPSNRYVLVLNYSKF